MAIANTTNRITLVTRPDELAEILDKPFAAWRLFLHPSQRRVAYRVSYGGPAQVTGGPGTGKTVAALHRVKHLLSRTPDNRVLLTTYTNALAATLREHLALLLDDEKQLSRVEVTTVNAFANRTMRALAGRAPTPVGDLDERQVWRRVCRRLTPALDRAVPRPGVPPRDPRPRRAQPGRLPGGQPARPWLGVGHPAAGPVVGRPSKCSTRS